MSVVTENKCIPCSENKCTPENSYKLYCGICGDDYSKNSIYKLL